MGVGVQARSWMRAALLVVVTLIAPLCFARTHLSGYVEQGGQRHLNSGIFSITRAGATQTNPYSMQSYPSATVTVYVTGTLTLATIYSDSAGTAKANPFTASSNAYWSFYVDNGIYDIRFSGGGITTPYTWSGIETSADSFVVSVTGFGAVCDNSTDDTAAIQAAISVTGPHRVVFPAATCVTTSQLLIDQHGIVLAGQGMRVSAIRLAPTATASLIKIQLGSAAVISQTEIRDLWLKSSDTTFAKTAIDIVDGSETLVEDVMIGPSGGWTGGASISPFTGSGSVGIRIRGREFGSFHRNLIAADIPLRVSANPNAASLSLDHHVFDDESYFIADDGNPNVLIDDGQLSISSVAFRDMAWVNGSYGLYWNDTLSTSGLSSNLTIHNVRPEQLESGAMIHINQAGVARLRDLSIDGVIGGAGTNVNGLFLSGVISPVVKNFFYTGNDECLDVDYELYWLASVCQAGSTKNLNTMTEIWSTGHTAATMPTSGYWEFPNATLTSGQCYRFMGVYQCAKTGTLADAATVQIPSLGGALTTGKIDITFAGATLNGAFSCTINAARTIRNWTSDSTIADCTGNVAGDITIHWSSASSIVLRNNLGESVTYNYLLTLN